MEIPAAAEAMYKTWWWLAYSAGTATEADGSYKYTVTDLSSAASDIRQNVYGGQVPLDVRGLSQLFSIGRAIGNATRALNNADDSAAIDSSMWGIAPWGRSIADQLAVPKWEATVQITYTDANGVQHAGEFAKVADINYLPATVGDFRAQVEIAIRAQLANAPGVKSPRTGQLDSIDSIQLIAV